MSSPPPSSDLRLRAGRRSALRAEIESALDELLDAVLSSRRTATQSAEALAKLTRAEQDFVLHWVSVIARTNAEMAFQFAAAAPRALQMLDATAAEAWIIQAMDVYDREGLYRGSQVFKNARAFATARNDAHATVAFDDIAQCCNSSCTRFPGAECACPPPAHAYTDTETLYFPARIAHRPTVDQNFLLYKAMAALLWAQSRYGTFNVDLQAACADFGDPNRALALLNALETIRLEACIGRVLPGLAREMAALRGRVAPDARCSRLLEPAATVHDSIVLLGAFYDSPPRYAILRIWECLEPAPRPRDLARLRREKDKLQAALARLARRAQAGTPEQAKPPLLIGARGRLAERRAPDTSLSLDGVACHAAAGHRPAHRLDPPGPGRASG